MDKIDLDTIINQDSIAKFMDTTDKTATKECMKEAIRQALVLASEKAKVDDRYDGMHSHPIVDKQSILDINDLVV